MPLIKMLRGPEPGKEILLEKTEITIGRGRKNDVVIQDNEVSRNHCSLVRVLDDYELHDYGSTNGTFVNGQPVNAGGWLLSAHTIIELGDSITFEYLPTEIATATNIPVMRPNETGKRPLYLVLRQESVEQPEIYLLDRSIISVGRDTDNDIILVEPEVSRHHLRFILSKTGYAVEELNTTNGTYLNDRRLLHQRMLRDSDHIRIGERVRMWYTADPDALIDSIKAGMPVKQAGRMNEMQKSESKTSSLAERDVSVSLRTTDRFGNNKSSTSALGHGLKPHQLEDSIFIAYARDDWEDVVVKVYDYLTQRGIKVWVEQYLIEETDSWEEAIEQANLEAKCLLAVVSKKSLETSYVKRSISRFISRVKPVLLLQYGDVKRLPLSVDNAPIVSYDDTKKEECFEMVLNELQKLTTDTSSS